MDGISKTGLKVRWGATHKRGGRLVSRQASIAPPIFCGKTRYIFKFLFKSWRYALILSYHRHRVEYAEKYPEENIKWKYRTGENAPETIGRAIWELFILKLRRRITWLKAKK